MFQVAETTISANLLLGVNKTDEKLMLMEN